MPDPLVLQIRLALISDGLYPPALLLSYCSMYCCIAIYSMICSATLKCVGYVYISIYETHARFSAPGGPLARTKNRATGERTQAARAGGDRPAPALVPIGHGQNGAVRH